MSGYYHAAEADREAELYGHEGGYGVLARDIVGYDEGRAIGASDDLDVALQVATGELSDPNGGAIVAVYDLTTGLECAIPRAKTIRRHILRALRGRRAA